MPRPTIPALALVLALGGAGIGPAFDAAGATTSVIGVGRDAVGDVRVTRAPGITERDRRSIDLRRLRIIDRGRIVRFAVRVKKVRVASEFVQIFSVAMYAPGYVFTELQVASAALTTPPSRDGLQHWIVTEGSGNPEGFVACENLDLSFRDGATRWSVDVPRRCLPQGRARIAMYAQTTAPVSEDLTQYSNDRLKLGRKNLGGTIPPSRPDAA